MTDYKSMRMETTMYDLGNRRLVRLVRRESKDR